MLVKCHKGHLREKGKKCKDCRKEYNKQYLLKNKEYLNKYQKEYHEKIKKPKRQHDKQNNTEYHQRQLQLKRDYSNRNRENYRRSDWSAYLKRNYGLTVDEYELMIIEHNNLCAICKQPEKLKHHITGTLKRLSIDHNHKTGKVRGLLCTRCNQAYGKLEESQEIIENMLLYHKKYAEE